MDFMGHCCIIEKSIITSHFYIEMIKYKWICIISVFHKCLIGSFSVATRIFASWELNREVASSRGGRVHIIDRSAS